MSGHLFNLGISMTTFFVYWNKTIPFVEYWHNAKQYMFSLLYKLTKIYFYIGRWLKFRNCYEMTVSLYESDGLDSVVTIPYMVILCSLRIILPCFSICDRYVGGMIIFSKTSTGYEGNEASNDFAFFFLQGSLIWLFFPHLMCFLCCRFSMFC